MVHGEWMTEAEAAEALGRSVITVRQWRYKHRRPDGKPALLVEAWDHYRAVNAGLIKLHTGQPTVRHRVEGRRMSRNEVAEALHMPVGTLDSYMHNHRCGLDAAYRHYADKQKRKAEQRILEIIRGG